MRRTGRSGGDAVVERRRVAPVVGPLTGLTIVEFTLLVDDLDPTWETERTARLAGRPRRMRAPGAGRPPIRFPARLLLGLVKLRWNASYRRVAAVFGVSKDTVQRVELELLDLLRLAGRPRWRPPTPDASLDVVLAAVGADGARAAFEALAGG